MGDLELPKPSIRVDAFGDILPTDGRRFVMGDFYTADQLREAVKQEREACAKVIESVGPKEGALGLVTQGFAKAVRARSEQGREG